MVFPNNNRIANWCVGYNMHKYHQILSCSTSNCFGFSDVRNPDCSIRFYTKTVEK